MTTRPSEGLKHERLKVAQRRGGGEEERSEDEKLREAGLPAWLNT